MNFARIVSVLLAGISAKPMKLVSSYWPSRNSRHPTESGKRSLTSGCRKMPPFRTIVRHAQNCLIAFRRSLCQLFATFWRKCSESILDIEHVSSPVALFRREFSVYPLNHHHNRWRVVLASATEMDDVANVQVCAWSDLTASAALELEHSLRILRQSRRPKQ